MVRAVAMDYGGVLVDLPSEGRNLARIAAHVGRSQEQLSDGIYGPGRERWNRAKVGHLPEPEYWRQAAQALALPAETVNWVRQQLFECVTLRADVVRYLESLRGPCLLALVSNAIPSFMDTWRRLGFLDLFDVAINSSAVGTAKPDTLILRIAAKRLGVEPAECVFVDDQAANVDAAAEAGFQAVRYIDAPQMIAAVQALRA